MSPLGGRWPRPFLEFAYPTRQCQSRTQSVSHRLRSPLHENHTRRAIFQAPNMSLC